MGVAAPSDAHAALNLVPELTWVVPDDWAAEEAATVPYAYSMVSYVTSRQFNSCRAAKLGTSTK